LRVVVDTQLHTPPSARLLDDAATHPVRIVAAIAAAQRASALRERGAEVMLRPGPDGRVDLAGVLNDLARDDGINELHVEAGPRLNGALLQHDLVDELLLYVAPSLLGGGRGLATMAPLHSMADARRWRFVAADPVGDDLRLRLRRLGRDAF
jgi:diaminohydroxyphosphoribosylaminopyrimidine deaminase/5-amino-6-(5-phosphoribosylamino)uracil reductase